MSMTIEGLDNLMRTMAQYLSPYRIRRAFVKYYQPYAKIVRDTARANAPRSRVRKPASARVYRSIYMRVVARPRNGELVRIIVKGRGRRGDRASPRVYARHLHLVIRGTARRQTARGFNRGAARKTYPNLLAGPGRQQIARARRDMTSGLVPIINDEILRKIRGK